MKLGHRRLRRRAGVLLDLLADRLAYHRVLAGRDAGEHPVHHRPGQRITISEVLVALPRQPMLVIDRAHPRPAHPHASAAERHRPAFVTVPLRRPVRDVLVPRAHDLVDLALHQPMHDGETETHAQREQPLPRCPDELAARLLNLRRQRTLQRLRGRHDLRAGYLLHGGSYRPLGPGFDRPERSQPERTRREDRHSKFYEISDNLSA
jgi:hypothetical protein